jgi:hypothetical protein
MFEASNLELDPLAKVTSMPEAGCEKLPRLLKALCLHAPLFSTRHHHCGVVGLHFGFGHPFQHCYSHGALFSATHTLAVREGPPEQIWNVT